ncbi:hypothetical protein [Falsiroseomonas frigidaquae]
MQQQISVITLGVADLARSRTFYGSGFGWNPVFENAEVIFYQMNGLMLGTWLRQALDADMNDAGRTGSSSYAPQRGGAGGCGAGHGKAGRRGRVPDARRRRAATWRLQGLRRRSGWTPLGNRLESRLDHRCARPGYLRPVTRGG